VQRNPQPRAQRPAARPQQGYNTPGQRPAARTVQTASNGPRVANQGAANGRPEAAARPRPVQTGRRETQQTGTRSPVRPTPRPSSTGQRRPAASSGQTVRRVPGSVPFIGSRDYTPTIITLIGVIAAIAIGSLMQYVIYPDGYFPQKRANAVETVAEIASSRGVRINEVMTSNKTALSDEKGEYPDWIELINTSGETMDITGWALLDKASRTTYFTFPEYQLSPGEIVLVYASGHLANENGMDFNAPFRLSSSGDTLMLSDNHSTVVESINLPALGANQAYSRQDNGWIVTDEYTPGMENTSLNYAMLTSTQPVASSALLITEVMADNASHPFADGALYDWIEIQNIGSSPIDLKGYGLSDSADKPAQWKFPSVTIQPGQYMVVCASGLDQQSADGSLHTNFGLRAEGESVLLYNDAGQVLDHVEFDNLKADQSLKRQADGSYTVSGTATPGQAN